MFDTVSVRKKVRETFKVFKQAEVHDEYGRTYIPSAPVCGLEDIIEVLITQIEREQERNQAIIGGVERARDRLKHEITKNVREVLR
ncbi:hypothetical protein RJP21_05010 [Paenibacillus sp. VCA1]|uniref:hypothetical protein n=1 Tax=Paenibacillus sp. VCA1 TaxID=3039148 RepID=UPI0028712DF8|nr:hypothetical protein [Paenibacillus sp. VCA1]MDR9852959.1 hypothetical protein [Paenibacillus sp. VCA1]